MTLLLAVWLYKQFSGRDSICRGLENTERVVRNHYEAGNGIQLSNEYEVL